MMSIPLSLSLWNCVLFMISCVLLLLFVIGLCGYGVFDFKAKKEYERQLQEKLDTENLLTDNENLKSNLVDSLMASTKSVKPEDATDIQVVKGTILINEKEIILYDEVHKVELRDLINQGVECNTCLIPFVESQIVYKSCIEHVLQLKEGDQSDITDEHYAYYHQGCFKSSFTAQDI